MTGDITDEVNLMVDSDQGMCFTILDFCIRVYVSRSLTSANCTLLSESCPSRPFPPCCCVHAGIPVEAMLQPLVNSGENGGAANVATRIFEMTPLAQQVSCSLPLRCLAPPAHTTIVHCGTAV